MSTKNGNYYKDGYVYFKSYKHYITGETIYPKTAKCFRIKVR